MPEEEFESKSHLTRHMTGSRYHLIRERSRINSSEEQDYVNWKEFLAWTLTPERLTPMTLKTIADVNKYRAAFKSFRFGPVGQIGHYWPYLLIGGIMAVMAFLYLSGYLG